MAPEEPGPDEHKWVLPDQAEQLPLPVAQRKILGLARAALEAALDAAAPTLPYEATPPNGSNPL